MSKLADEMRELRNDVNEALTQGKFTHEANQWAFRFLARIDAALRAAEPSRDAALDVMASLPPDLPNGWMSAATEQSAPRDCKHGQLARSCEICDLIADNERYVAIAAIQAAEIVELERKLNAQSSLQSDIQKKSDEYLAESKHWSRMAEESERKLLAAQAEIEQAYIELAFAGIRPNSLSEGIKELRGKLAEAENFQRFAIAVLEESREELADLDGGWLQDTAEEFGLLERITVTEPCGEMCRCEDFPQECLRYPQSIKAAIDSARGAKEG